MEIGYIVANTKQYAERRAANGHSFERLDDARILREEWNKDLSVKEWSVFRVEIVAIGEDD
jgi:hypothetical protein